MTVEKPSHIVIIQLLTQVTNMNESLLLNECTLNQDTMYQILFFADQKKLNDQMEEIACQQGHNFFEAFKQCQLEVCASLIKKLGTNTINNILGRI